MPLKDAYAQADDISFDRKKIYRPPHEVNFTPKIWDHPNIANTIGPWAYALDLPQIGKAKPGRLNYESDTDVFEENFPQTQDELAVALQKDGVMYYNDFLPEEGHIIAFYTRRPSLKKFDEILIARRDSNGGWSYTAEGGGCGDYYPQQEDLRGEPITDIRKAYLCGFDIFLGFAAIPYAGISYYPRVIVPNEYKNLSFRDIPAVERFGFDL